MLENQKLFIKEKESEPYSCKGCYFYTLPNMCALPVDHEGRDICSEENIIWKDNFPAKDDKLPTTLGEYISKFADKLQEEKPSSNVESPKHYMLFPEHNIQVRDVMKVLCDKMDKIGYTSFLASDYVQAMQYFMRWFEKNGVEDLEKGVWYINKMINTLKEGNNG